MIFVRWLMADGRWPNLHQLIHVIAAAWNAFQ
jgi:hypothetical protein